MAGGKTYYRKRKYLKRAKKAKKTAKLSKPMKRAIQKLISKNIEDKRAFISSGNSLIYYNSGINSVGDFTNVLPTIQVGSTEAHRIGCKIRAKSLVIKGYMQLEPDVVVNSVDNKRVGVRLMVLTSKRFKNYSDMANTAGANLIERGSAATTFNGNISDLYAPVNREEWTPYYDKVHYLSQSYTAQQVGSSTPTVQWSVDMTKGIRFFTIRIPLRGKILNYEPNVASDLPTNFGIGICLGYAHLNAASPDVVSTKVGLCWDANFTYEDA